jgi:hypothetical protein
VPIAGTNNKEFHLYHLYLFQEAVNLITGVFIALL